MASNQGSLLWLSLAEFIGCKAGDTNAFIRDPEATKVMNDVVQVVHSKTLRACFILVTSSSKAHPDVLFRDMVMTLWRARLHGRSCISKP